MLSYYLSWHMHARLAPLLFTDDTSPPPRPPPQPVAPAARSPHALAKAATKQTPGDLPVHSFATLLADLGTICLNTIARHPALPGFPRHPPTALQRQALELLGVSHRLGRVVSTPAPRTPKVQVNAPTRGSLGLRLAHRAPMVNVFDDAPLPVLVASSPTTSYRVTRRSWAAAGHQPGRADMLLDTLAAFFAFQGSAIEAGKHLYCHPKRCATGCAASSVRPAAR